MPGGKGLHALFDPLLTGPVPKETLSPPWTEDPLPPWIGGGAGWGGQQGGSRCSYPLTSGRQRPDGTITHPIALSCPHAGLHRVPVSRCLQVFRDPYNHAVFLGFLYFSLAEMRDLCHLFTVEVAIPAE